MPNARRQIATAVVIAFACAAETRAQNVFEQIGEGIKHVVNEADKVVRDVAPVQVDFRQGGRIIVNGPTESVAIDPGSGRTITTPSPARRFVEGLPGQPMCQAVWSARAAVRRRYPIPADVARDLMAVGVPAHIIRKATWSPDWYATNYMPGTGNQGGVTLDDIILISDNRLVQDRAFMAHELKHVQQYDRLGMNNFCSQYTTNSWIFENEAKDEEVRVERALEARPGWPAGRGVGNGWTSPPPMPTPVPVRQQVYYSYCQTPAGTSPVIQGGYAPGASCNIPTVWGPSWGNVVGFYR
jgi:hypothetical protein